MSSQAQSDKIPLNKFKGGKIRY